MTELEEAAKAFAEAEEEFRRCVAVHELFEAQEDEYSKRRAEASHAQHTASIRRADARVRLLAIAAKWKP